MTVPVDENRTERNRRLWRTKLYKAFRERVTVVAGEQGIAKQAAEKIVICEPEFRHPDAACRPDPKATPAEQAAVEDEQAAIREQWEAGGSSRTYLDDLQWVANSMGLVAAGVLVEVGESPSATAWGIFQEAKRGPAAFYKLWADESRRRQGDSGDDEQVKADAKRSIDEIDEMLAEIKESTG